MTHDPDGPRHIRAFDVDGRPASAQRPRCSRSASTACSTASASTSRATSGPAPATASTATTAAGDLLGRIPIGEGVSNVTFGGPKRNRLFITATTSLYAVYLNANGAQRP